MNYLVHIYILLVEDEKLQSEFIQKALEKNLYRVDCAFDGGEAIKKIEVRDYDLAIVDLNLPVASGSEIIQKIREIGLSTSILVLTANDEVSSKVSNLDLGADDYLAKPFSLEELLARVRSLMRRIEKPQPTIFKAGSLELIYGTHEVKISGNLIKLTKNEFRLLDFLSRNTERVCTRAMIEEHVWGYNQNNDSNVIEAVVNSLRKKLGAEVKK